LQVPRVRFRVRGWVDDETYRELLRVARYLGRSNGYALFELDPWRVESSGLSLEDLVALLTSIEGVVEEDIEALVNAVEEYRRVTVDLGDDGFLRVKSRMMLRDLLRELGLSLPYSREERAYRAAPYLYRDIVESLQRMGVIVDDQVGLLGSYGRLPRPISFRGQLRPYQEEALAKWEANGHRGIIALPTGAGKTVIAIAGIARLGVKTLVVVYTKEQVKQWIDSILKFTDAGAMVGAFYGDEKRIAPITVTTYQTAYRKVKLFTRYFALVVFDEAHHVPADKFRRIATMMAAPYRLGLSATIEREDGKHVEIFPLLGGIVYHTSPGELARQGYLAAAILRTVRVELKPEEKRKYERLRRLYQQLARGRTVKELVEAARRGDPDAKEALRVASEMRRIIQYSEAKLSEATRLIKREVSKGSKVIVFTQYKAQAEEIARRVGGLLIHGGLDKRARERALDLFKSLPSGVLVVTTVGDEGLDIPDANVGVLLSGTSSQRQFVQRLGRLLRPKPGNNNKAVLYEIIVAGTSEEYQSRKRKGVLS